jgi:transcriptional regulator with XRE-family HTH domain
MDIGQAIKELRMKQGMTQEQLAAKCSMSTNAISSLETGKAYPPKSTVEKLCRAFGIPVSYMLMAAIEEQDIPEEKRVLYRALLEPLRNELLEKQ